MFDLSVDPSVMKTVNGHLPAMTRGRVLSTFDRIMVYGLTALSHNSLWWDSPTEFSLLITRRPLQLDLQGGVTIRGSMDADQPGRVWLHDIELAMRPVTLPKRFCYRPKPKKRTQKELDRYARIEHKWIDEELDNPFIQNCAYRESWLIDLPVTLTAMIEGWFYTDVEQLLHTKTAETLFGFRPHIDEEAVASYARRLRVDRDTTAGFLKRSLRHLKNQSGVLGIVNFIDNTDPLSRAQVEFINVATFAIKQLCPDMDVLVVDVIINDEDGQTPHWDVFREYHGQNRFWGRHSERKRWPFSMVFGRRYRRYTNEQLRLPLDDGGRLFDVDLFADHRKQGQSRVMLNAQYSASVRNALFDLLRAACTINSQPLMKVLRRDFRGMPEATVQEYLETMLKTSAVVLVNADVECDLFKLVVQSCIEAKCEGAPLIKIVQTDSVPPGSVAVPLDTACDKMQLFKQPRADLPADACSEIVDGIFKAYDTNIYLDMLYSATFWHQD